jgi:predicted aspartyl protease
MPDVRAAAAKWLGQFAVECWRPLSNSRQEQRHFPPAAGGHDMESELMGRVLTEATIENLRDIWDAQRGMIPLEDVRRISVKDALVDTGATLVSLPQKLIRQLGLEQTGWKRVRSTAGVSEAAMYSAVRLTILGRSCTMDVMAVGDDVPVLIGQIPLEHLDLVVDAPGGRLVGNPEHGGEHTYELY